MSASLEISYPSDAELSAANAGLCGGSAYLIGNARRAIVEDDNGDLFYYVPGVGFLPVGMSYDGEIVDL